jgi:hypothetical protein
MDTYEPYYGGPWRGGASYWDSVDYPLERRPGRYSYRSPDLRCTYSVLQNGLSSQELRLCPVHLYDDIDDEDVFDIFGFRGGLGNMNMSSWTRNFQLPRDTVGDRPAHSRTSLYAAQLDPWGVGEGGDEAMGPVGWGRDFTGLRIMPHGWVWEMSSTQGAL